MANYKVVSEKPVTMIGLKEHLERIEKRDKELKPKAIKTKEYLSLFKIKDKKTNEELAKKIDSLNIPRLKERHIIKILDVMPEDLDSLKMILTGENITIKQEDLDKILKVIKK